jgi:hypothetical protein
MACERVLCVPRSATSCGGADGDGGKGHVFYVFKPDGDKARELIVAFVNAP